MKCEKCNVYVKTLTDECPLCKHKLDKNETENLQLTFPSIKKYSRIKKIFQKIFVALMFSLMIICGLVNYATFEMYKSYWSVIAIFSCLLLLIIYKVTKRKWYEFAKTIFSSTLLVSCLLIIIDLFSIEGISKPTWSIDYTLPLILVSGLIASFSFLVINKHYFSQFIFYTIILIVLNLAMFFNINNTDVIWPILVCVCSAIIALVTLLVVLREKLKDEFERRFHA